MSVIDHILSSDGYQLTDEELSQLAEVVKKQQRLRSPLNTGELVLDKGEAEYEDRRYDWKSRQQIIKKLTTDEAIAIMRGEQIGHIRSLKVGGRQDKFIRMACKRSRNATKPIKLMQKMFSTAVIDIPLAKDIVESLENEVSSLRKEFEKQAQALPDLVEKQKMKSLRKTAANAS